ncbi:glycerophosphodiester phosphodiesterase family protein [Henriciella sp. AS95]|uniref:glycerophosphodiester phosphodiesterase family protein n=1 Tax=Henriciella sp. AS95 TaxID=3135782 RepID=UPI00317E70DF
MASRFNILDFSYAHRGLWSDDTHPENSLEAILTAAGRGFGCELDVRPAACGTPIVFHDPLLDRMTDESGLVSGRSAAEITSTPLKGGGTLPTLETVLSQWPDDKPLLIELKIDGETDAEGFAGIVSELVNRHDGMAALMSFSRRAIAAVPREIMRGALILPSSMSDEITLQALISTSAGFQPDYIACHVTDAKQAAAIATDYGLPVATWTVSTADMSASLKALPVAQIFEGFDPAFAD